MTNLSRLGDKYSMLGSIPHDWAVNFVGELGEIRLGRQRSPQNETGAFMKPYLRVANVFDGYIDFSDVLEMNFTPAEQAIYDVRRGDILLNEGQSLDLVGRCAKYDGPNGKFCFQNTLIRYRCSRLLDSDFAYHVFSWWLRTRRFTKVAKQTTSIAHLGADRLAAMPMAVPSISEQRRIVELLKGIDESIRATEQLIAKLERSRVGLIRARMTGDRSWIKYRLGEVIPEVEYGVSIPLVYGSKTPVLRMNNLSDGEVTIADIKSTDFDIPLKLMLKPGDVLFNRTNSIDHVGRTAIWRGAPNTHTFASYLVRLNCDPEQLLPEYLNLWMSRPEVKTAIRTYATPGVHQVNINPTNLRKTWITLPPHLADQESTVREISAQTGRIAHQKAELAKLRKVKQGLVDDLLTGRVRVDVAA